MDKKLWCLAIFLLISLIILITFSSNNSIDQSNHSTDMNQKPIEIVQHTQPSYEAVNSNNHIDTSIKQMSLEEKVGQLIMGGVSGTHLNDIDRQLITDYHIGGLIFFAENLKNPNQTSSLLNDIKDSNKKNPLPLFLGIDQEGGRVTRLPNLHKLPTNQKIGEINEPSFSYRYGELLGQQVSAFGFNVNFAPVLDVNNNPNNPVIGDRAFGDQSDIVSTHGNQVMKGIEAQGVVPVIKHFPGHGDTTTDSHMQLPVSRKSIKELNEVELVPFQSAIQEGANMVMVAHMLFTEIDDTNPSSISEPIITGLLREQLSFEGVVITDDMTMQAITNHYEIGQAAVKSIQAGTDIIMVAHDYNKITNTYHSIKEAVEDGDISESRIDQSIKRIIQLKEKYNLERESVTEASINQLNNQINDLFSDQN